MQYMAYFASKRYDKQHFQCFKGQKRQNYCNQYKLQGQAHNNSVLNPAENVGADKANYDGNYAVYEGTVFGSHVPCSKESTGDES